MGQVKLGQVFIVDDHNHTTSSIDISQGSLLELPWKITDETETLIAIVLDCYETYLRRHLNTEASTIGKELRRLAQVLKDGNNLTLTGQNASIHGTVIATTILRLAEGASLSS